MGKGDNRGSFFYVAFLQDVWSKHPQAFALSHCIHRESLCKMMNRTLAIAAALGFLASATIFGLTFFVEGERPYGWMLWPGIFIVWFPTVLLLNSKGQDWIFTLPDRVSPWALLAFLIIAPLFFAGAIMPMFATRGVATYQDGRYVIVNHGQIQRELTEAEFDHGTALEQRAASAISMMLYAIAAVTLAFVPPGPEPKPSAPLS